MREEIVYFYHDEDILKKVELPFYVGTIVELKEKPFCTPRIVQYILREDKNGCVKLFAGLVINIYKDEVDFEIPIEELIRNWKKTDLSDFNNFSPSRFNPDCKTFEELEAKIKLAKKL